MACLLELGLVAYHSPPPPPSLPFCSNLHLFWVDAVVYAEIGDEEANPWALHTFYGTRIKEEKTEHKWLDAGQQGDVFSRVSEGCMQHRVWRMFGGKAGQPFHLRRRRRGWPPVVDDALPWDGQTWSATTAASATLPSERRPLDAFLGRNDAVDSRLDN